MSTSDNTRPEVFPRRIVSLVPSLTELLASWGLIDRLAGRTRYCEEPRELVSRVETVGGTKNPDISRILELRPDLVVVNREENRREDYEDLIAAGLAVHVTHPRTVAEAADMFVALGAAVGASEEAEALATRSRAALAAAEAARPARAVPTFCPIWRNPWMTFCDRTYIGDMLTVAGLANVFGGDDARDFFEVDLAEAKRRTPTLVLLPDEPYVFEEKHVKELEDFGFSGRFELVSGKDLSWYGPRMPEAVTRLVAFAGKVAASSAAG